MEARSSLSQEQKHVLATVFHFLESSLLCLRSVLPIKGVVHLDEQVITAQIELGETCMRNLPRHFPELQPRARDAKKRGGR